jgi:glycine/D-amino acid oxidase-like deaminating enzyme
MYSTGRLTRGDRSYKAEALKSKETLVRFGITSEVLNHDELKYRWQQINVEGIEAGLYFAGGAGGSTLMARESCQVVGNAFTKAGGKLKIGKVTPGLSLSNKMQNINLDNGEKAEAQIYIFACGPWMGKLFPDVFAEKLKIYRRDVLFVGPAPGDDRYSYPNFPVWSSL